MLLDKCLLHISEHMCWYLAMCHWPTKCIVNYFSNAAYEFNQIYFSTPKASGTYPDALVITSYQL
jgi:hypothetical protein